jgi:hypothetical protein
LTIGCRASGCQERQRSSDRTQEKYIYCLHLDLEILLCPVRVVLYSTIAF